MDKLKEKQNIINERINTVLAKSAFKDDLKAFATLFLKVLKESKDDFKSISDENKALIGQTITYLEQEHDKLKDNVSQETENVRKELQSTLAEVQKLALEVKNSVPKDGNDGMDGYTPVKGEDYFTDSEIKDIKDSILEQIPEQQNIEEIVKGINDLPTNDPELKIDAKHIKNLPEQVVYRGGGVSGIKEIIAGSNITVDNSNLGYPVISSTGGGGSSSWGSITGTLSDQTDLQTALNAKQATLVSGTNIKTINGTSLLGSGDISISGSVSDGDKGDITVSSSGTVWTIDNLAVTNAKINDVAWTKISSTPTTLSGYGISDTKANFDSALSDGNFLYVGDITQYTDEMAQDAVGTILTDSSEIDFTYNDATPSITASIVAGSIDETKLDASVNASLDLADSALQSSAIGVSIQAYDADLTDLAGKWTRATASGQASLQFSEDTDNGTNKVTLQSAASLASDYTVTLPSATGTLALTSDIPSLSGYVNTSGTPANNQIAIFTDADTIEGDSSLTYDGTSFNLATAKNFQIAGATILADSSGTTTLSNIDALDATTEATIESAIDTLANLTSIQGRTVTLADAGADAFLIWDDSASAYQNSSQADARTILGLGTAAYVATDLSDLNEATIESAIDTLANLTSIQGRTITLADAGADAIFGWDDSANAYQNLSASDVRTALGLATSDSPQFTGIELGHASDTTLARVSAGVVSIEGVNIVTVSATQTLTNKTLTNSNNVLGGVTMTLGSDADGDIYYRSSNVLTRLPKGTADQVLTMNAGATAPEWQDASGGGDAFAQTSKPTTYWTTQIPITSTTLNQTGAISTWDYANINTASCYVQGHYASLLSDDVNNYFYINSIAVEPAGTGETTTGFLSKRFSDTKKLVVSFMYKKGASGNAVWGLADGVSVLNTPSSVDESIVFTFDGTNLNAKTSDGSNLTESSDITGITTTNWNLYRIEWDPASEARFYVNGNLKATITTTLPSVTNTIKFGCGASSTAQRYGLSSPVVSVEL